MLEQLGQTFIRLTKHAFEPSANRRIQRSHRPAVLLRELPTRRRDAEEVSELTKRITLRQLLTLEHEDTLPSNRFEPPRELFGVHAPTGVGEPVLRVSPAIAQAIALRRDRFFEAQGLIVPAV